MLQTVIIFTENDYNKQEIIKYQKLSAINNNIISNRNTIIANRNSVIAYKDSIIDNNNAIIKKQDKIIKVNKIKTYIWFGSGVAIGFIIKSLL